MNRFKRMKLVVVSCLAILLISCPGIGQTSSGARISYDHAYQVFDQEGIEASTPFFYAVADNFPGTPWGAKALFHLGLFTEPGESLAAYERIVAEYAGTDFEYRARMYIILHEFGYDAQARIDRKDLLAQSLGGPAVADIMSSGATEYFATLRAMPRRTQFDLGIIYDSIWLDMASGLRRPKYALPLAIFKREVFVSPGLVPSYAITNDIYRGLGVEVDQPKLKADPLVSIETPPAGAVTGPSPEIFVRITGGDFNHHQVDLGKLEFLLDGQDIKPITAVASTINRTPELGEPLEVLTLTTTPQAPLAPGTHTLTLVVPTESYTGEGPGRTTVTQTFIVGTPSGPTTETLSATGDSTLIIRNPHQNEGANPRLHLKKVTGKPAQVVVGFDTTNLDTTGLTKASLVLNIDSTQNVTGWGNGRPIRAQRLLTAWTEGNGKKLGLPGNQQSSGSGSGVTWFSPIDGNIANNQADSAVNWNGGASHAAPSTAPTINITNHQSGEVIFDVTQDLLNGAEHGWLITRDQDVGSQVTFLSKESANPDLAPRLILEYGGPIASAPAGSLFSQLSIHSFTNKLHPITSPSELRSIKQLVQESPTAILVVEHLLNQTTTHTNPLLSTASRTAYRAWLRLG